MFKELGPLLRQRTVVMILTRLEDDTIRVNVIPRKLSESENDALTTPLSVSGTAEDLDSQLPSALVQFVGAHLELNNTLESAKEQMAAAGKAARAEARSKTAPKAATGKTETAAVETKKPAALAPRPAEPAREEPPRNSSLFEAGPAPSAAFMPESDADDEEEILDGSDDQVTADENEELEEAV